eukprot:3493736-Rhodomonas_salina.1
MWEGWSERKPQGPMRSQKARRTRGMQCCCRNPGGCPSLWKARAMLGRSSTTAASRTRERRDGQLRGDSGLASSRTDRSLRTP